MFIEKTKEQILNSEEIILVDGSFAKTDEIAWEVYNCKKYEHIHPKILEKTRENLTEFGNFIKHPNVYVIPEITKEVSELEKIIEDKIRFIEERNKFNGKIYKRGEIKKNSREIRDISKELINEIQSNLYNILRTLKKKEIDHENRLYFSPVLDIVKKLSKIKNLKKDSHQYYHYDQQENNPFRSDTDEKLVALSYCLSLQKKQNSIITADYDFIRLFGSTPKIIGADIFLPQNKKFRESTVNFPYHVYFQDKKEDKIGLILDGKKIKFYEKFILKEKENESDDEKKERETNEKELQEFIFDKINLLQKEIDEEE